MTPSRISNFGFRIANWSSNPQFAIRNSQFRTRGLPLAQGCLAVLLFLLMPLMAWACPGCKEALVEPGELPQRLALAKGYALSIGLLLGMPALLVSGVTLRLMRVKSDSHL